MKHMITFGLHPSIKADVLSFTPVDIHDAIRLAFSQEQKNLGQPKQVNKSISFSKNTNPSVHSPSNSNPKSLTSISPFSLSSSASLPGVGKVPFKKLSPAEIQQKREFNLCFNCDEKYQKGHGCSAPPQILLLLTNEESPDDPFLVSLPPLSDSPPPVVSSDSPSLLTICLHALMDGVHPSTLWYAGYITGLPAQILVDGGSTHNFINPRGARKLKLSIEPSMGFFVMVGNGQGLICLGVITGVPITIQEFSFVTDFFVIYLHGSNLMLGVAWLATVGPSITDSVNCLFEFDCDGKHIRWVGDLCPDPTQINLLSVALPRWTLLLIF